MSNWQCTLDPDHNGDCNYLPVDDWLTGHPSDNKSYCLTNPKFDALLHEMGELHDAKNAGYAVVNDPLHNFRACENFGIPMYKGLAVRITDKQSRWQNLVRDADNDKVGESLEDTTMDEAVYLLLFLIALEEYKKVTPVKQPTLSLSAEQHAIQKAGVPVAVVPRGLDEPNEVPVTCDADGCTQYKRTIAGHYCTIHECDSPHCTNFYRLCPHYRGHETT